MHTVELLEEACVAARRLGYRLRHAWLDGGGGGPCEVRGEKWIFLDLAQTQIEQLGMLVETLRGDDRLKGFYLSPDLCRLLHLAPRQFRRAA